MSTEGRYLDIVAGQECSSVKVGMVGHATRIEATSTLLTTNLTKRTKKDFTGSKGAAHLIF